jgi:hypothetical protein
VSAVLGETKPQFTLLGDTVLKTQGICAYCPPQKVAVSKLTHHYLELYTNNYWFNQQVVYLKGFGNEAIFYISILRGRMKNVVVPEKTAAKNFDGTLAADGPATLKDGGVAAEDVALKKDKKGEKEKGGQYGVNLNESDSVASGSAS